MKRLNGLVFVGVLFTARSLIIADPMLDIAELAAEPDTVAACPGRFSNCFDECGLENLSTRACAISMLAGCSLACPGGGIGLICGQLCTELGLFFCNISCSAADLAGCLTAALLTGDPLDTAPACDPNVCAAPAFLGDGNCDEVFRCHEFNCDNGDCTGCNCQADYVLFPPTSVFSTTCASANNCSVCPSRKKAIFFILWRRQTNSLSQTNRSYSYQ